ncbi:SDR family NAD(P)-dependent oxidoreductase [Alteromonas halophila]|uniref:20-beta-hydroxysteroid dehydrogenase n=1 Tax=Alteromonas halophila TaxID=516698 RepID=A0A918JMP1_9ALTE|nr:SDR family NAD(P)-dependent oxidoreductase [Alteromonas halophila]GGW87694.1 20-beta-hydroxysteroid dehydrogenase [Alteromonas halophila]
MTKTVFVTGGNRGIGFEIVRGFAKAGYKVMMGCRDEDEGNEVKEDIVGGDVHVIEMSLSNEQGIIDALTRATAVYGGIDILVNNAGVLCRDGVEDVSMGDVSSALQVHVQAPLTLIQQVLPGMKERGFGRIINMSSGWGAFAEGMEGPVAYAISKAALNALTLNVANELEEESNITVNSVCPGWVHTRMGGTDAPKSPEEGADTVVWLGTLEDETPNGKFVRERKEIDW